MNMQPPGVDYRALFVKYMALLDREEGSCFLGRLDWHDDIRFTAEERAALFARQTEASALSGNK